MSAFEPISIDFADVLKAEPEYDAMPVETYECEHCGHCEDPRVCVWGVQCPVCFAEPKEQCKGQGNRLVGLHEERWQTAANTSG